MNLERSDHCDPQRLEEYLNNSLGGAAVMEVEDHLTACSNCREQLELSACTQAEWHKMKSMLRDDDFDCESVQAMVTCGDFEADSRGSETDMISREIQGWLDPSDDPQSLGRFAGYEIVGIVGHGGMGIVLKGFEVSLNRFVAIKVLAPRMATNVNARKRFAREAQAAAAVRHDNVIAIHRVEEWHGLPFLVMPYVGGVSLQKRIDTDGALSLEQTLRVGVQIAAGLAAAHAQGLIHRDIKPANILLEQGVERVTITDFGLARAADDASVTRTGIIAGTPQYMSPEQAEAKPLNPSSDLFSLGSVLYAAATGRPPFRGDGSFEVLKRIVSDPARRMRELEPTVPDWFERLVTELHAKSPAERPQSAAELAETLRNCLAHVQQPDSAPLPDSVANTSLVRKSESGSFRRAFCQRTRLLPAILVMFVGISLCLSSMFLWQTTNPPDISGTWTAESWGLVEIKLSEPGKYEGATGNKSKAFALKWSRFERRYNGTWREGDRVMGKISIRLVNQEIRGAWTTKNKVRTSSETPKLADLLWTRSVKRPSARNTPPPDDPPEGILNSALTTPIEMIDDLGAPVVNSNKPTIKPSATVILKVIDSVDGHIVTDFEIGYGHNSESGRRIWAENDSTKHRFNRQRKGELERVTLSGDDIRRTYLRISANGYVPLPVGNQTIAQLDGHEVTVALHRGKQLKGRVTGRDEQPLPGSTVFLIRENHRPQTTHRFHRHMKTYSGSIPFVTHTDTNEQGQFTLNGLDDDSRWIAVLAPGRALVILAVKQGSKNDSEWIDFKLPDPSALVVRVVPSSTNGDEYIDIRLVSGAPHLGSTFELDVDKNGSCRAEGMAPGSYTVSLMKRVMTPDAGRFVRLDLQEVILSGGESQVIEFARPAGRVLKGKVLGLKRHVLRGAIISLTRKDNHTKEKAHRYIEADESVSTKEDGRFETGPLAEGWYIWRMVAYKPDKGRGGYRVPDFYLNGEIYIPSDAKPDELVITIP